MKSKDEYTEDLWKMLEEGSILPIADPMHDIEEDRRQRLAKAKVGDWLTCVGKRKANNPKTDSRLTLGRRYRVVSFSGTRQSWRAADYYQTLSYRYVQVINDNGKVASYSLKWFDFDGSSSMLTQEDTQHASEFMKELREL